MVFRRAGTGAPSGAAAAACALLCCCMRWCCSCSFTASCSCFSSSFPWCSSPLAATAISLCLFLLVSALSSLLPAALLSLLCFFHSQTSMLKNTGLIDCIKARELHRPEAEEIFHVGCWCDLLLSCCSKAKRIACSRTCLLTCSAPQAEKFGFEMQMRSAARFRDGGSSGAPACSPPEMALLLVLCCCCASLRADLRESLTDERESKWPAGRQLARSREPAVLRKQEPFLVCLLIS